LLCKLGCSIHIQKFEVGKFSFEEEINTFIEQGCIKLFESESKDIYNVSKYFYFK